MGEKQDGRLGNWDVRTGSLDGGANHGLKVLHGRCIMIIILSKMISNHKAWNRVYFVQCDDHPVWEQACLARRAKYTSHSWVGFPRADCSHLPATPLCGQHVLMLMSESIHCLRDSLSAPLTSSFCAQHCARHWNWKEAKPVTLKSWNPVEEKHVKHGKYWQIESKVLWGHRGDTKSGSTGKQKWRSEQVTSEWSFEEDTPDRRGVTCKVEGTARTKALCKCHLLRAAVLFIFTTYAIIWPLCLLSISHWI